MSQVTPGGGRSTPPERPPEKSGGRGRFAALLGFAQLPGFAGVRGPAGPHPRGPGSGPRGLSGLCPSALTRPRLPAASGGLKRYFGPLSAPSRPACPRPPPAGWAPGRLGFGCRFAAPLASSLARCLGLSARGPCASLRRALPPGVPACGRVLAPAPPPFGRLRSGLSAGPSLSGPAPRPAGLCGLPGRSPLARLRARPWPSPGPSRRPGSPFARPPPAGGGSSPCGARPGLVAPVGRRGPAGRFWRLCRPPGFWGPVA